jgi:hypothetical protein
MQVWAGLQQFEAPRIPRQSALEYGKVVSPIHRPALSQKINWYSVLLQADIAPGS